MVAFDVCGQTFGAPIRAVKETLPPRPVTPLFLVPRLVAGLINLRGEVVAVLDVEELLDLPRSRTPVDERAIVILRPPASWAGGARNADRPACGLLVDKLLGVQTIADGELRPPPPTLAAEPAQYLSGVAAVGEPVRPLLLLDPERVLSTDRLRPFRKARAA